MHLLGDNQQVDIVHKLCSSSSPSCSSLRTIDNEYQKIFGSTRVGEDAPNNFKRNRKERRCTKYYFDKYDGHDRKE